MQVLVDQGDRLTVWQHDTPVTAAERDMDGDQHDGWTAFVAPDELTLLRVDERELPV